MLQLNISVFLMAGATLFAKLITLSALQITLLRSMLALPALALFCLLVLKVGLTLPRKRDYAFALLIGGLLAAHWATVFYAIKVSTVSIATIALFTFPIITILIEPLVFRHALQRRDLFSGLVVLVGVVLLVPAVGFDNSTFTGVFWGIVSAFAYALRNILVRKYLNHCPGGTAMFYQMLAIVILLAPWLDWNIDLMVDHRLLYLICLGVLFTALPHTLFVNSLKQMSAKTASLVSCLHPLYGVILAMLLLNEMPNFRTLLGGALIVSTAIYETMYADKRTG